MDSQPPTKRAKMEDAARLGAVRALAVEYKGLERDPVEGFRVRLVDDEDMFLWEVAVFGPPETLYTGGYFKAQLKFPPDYPYSPPTIRFLSKIWHPNVYENGDVCVSILHPPGGDLQSGELPCERWNPTQSVRTILLSVVSLLNEPNTSSPANVSASVSYRRWKESKGKDREYETVVRNLVALTKVEAAKDQVKVPQTMEEYCAKEPVAEKADMPDLFDDDYYNDYDDESGEQSRSSDSEAGQED